MNFVYIHIALFTAWMVFIESKPWPMLTQAAFQQAKADHDFTEQELELKTNTELTREIDKLTTELHQRLVGKAAEQRS